MFKKITLASLWLLSSFCMASSIGDVVPVFVGEITHKSVDEFILKHDSRTDLKQIIIFSQGGEVGAGIKFGHWVHRKNLDVTVRTMCFSACANYVFVAGKRKIIEPGAFVGWHGDMEQKDFRDLITKYESISSRAKKSKLSRNDGIFLTANAEKYQILKDLRESQAELYAKLKLDSRFGRIGQEPVSYTSDGWTLTKNAMNYFDIENVEVPDNYATVEYLSATPLPRFINKGPLLILDVDNSGVVIPVNLAQLQETNAHL